MSGDPYIKENDELRAEIARLEGQLLIAQGCAALSSIGIDAHSALVDASKETMGKLIKAEAEIARLRAALREIAAFDVQSFEAELARKALKEGE